MLKAGLLKYAATKTDNEVLKGSLDATGNALILAGAATPAARVTQNAFGVNRLNGQHLAKLADAEALAASTSPKTIKAKKAPVKVSFAGKILRGAGKALAPVGYALAGYAAVDTAYRVFSKTGNSAKAAVKGFEAGADSLTMGQTSKWRANPQNSFESMINRRTTKALNHNKAAVKVRSVQGALRAALRAAKSANMKAAKPKAKPIAGLTPSRVKVKAHTRKSGGQNVRVKTSYRTIR